MISTPRPKIVIPKSQFHDFGNPSDMNPIEITDDLVLMEVIGLGSQGLVYTGVLSADYINRIHPNIVNIQYTKNDIYDIIRQDVYNYQQAILYPQESLDSKIRRPQPPFIQVAVKEMEGRVNCGVHILASRIGIGPKIYQIIYVGGDCGSNDITRGNYPKTYIVFEKLVRTLTFQDLSTSYGLIFAEMATILMKVGIFHNDLRDTNIMIDEEGHLKIIDYDSAEQAFMFFGDGKIPIITKPEYDDLLNKNYYMYINGKKYVVPYSFVHQMVHNACRIDFLNLLDTF